MIIDEKYKKQFNILYKEILLPLIIAQKESGIKATSQFFDILDAEKELFNLLFRFYNIIEKSKKKEIIEKYLKNYYLGDEAEWVYFKYGELMKKINKEFDSHENIEFDSQEEELFWYYLEELQENGYIDKFEYNTRTFTLSEAYKHHWKEILKTKTKDRETTLLQPHVYTPDFIVYWNMKAHKIFFEDRNSERSLDKIPFISNDGNPYAIRAEEASDISYIEIKPGFDYQNMTRLFVLNQKWMMAEHNIYIQKIVPTGKNTCLFAKTFVPTKALLTKKTKKAKVFKYPIRTLKEFVNG